MFKFNDLSEGNDFNIAEYRLSPREFFEKRRTSKRPYVFDLRSSEAHEVENIPASHSLPIEHFETSIYQMPFAGDILLYGGECGEGLTAAEILYDNGFDSFNFTDSFEALFSSADTSYMSITDPAGKQINDEMQKADALKGVQVIVEPTSPLKAHYRLELVESPLEGSIKYEVSGIKVFSERKNVSYLEGTIIEISISEAENEVTPKSVKYTSNMNFTPRKHKLSSSSECFEKSRKTLKFVNPGAPTSFSLVNLHKHLFGCQPEQSHGAEVDCLSLMKTTAALGDEWIDWVKGNCFKFETCKKMWG